MCCPVRWTWWPEAGNSASALFTMGMSSKLANWAPKLTQATGILLILLGAIHLVATPFLVGWVSRQMPSGDVVLAIAAIRLNHILVGILLIPLGLSTFWAGNSQDNCGLCVWQR
jgi:hypothetical protein